MLGLLLREEAVASWGEAEGAAQGGEGDGGGRGVID